MDPILQHITGRGRGVVFSGPIGLRSGHGLANPRADPGKRFKCLQNDMIVLFGVCFACRHAVGCGTCPGIKLEQRVESQSIGGCWRCVNMVEVGRVWTLTDVDADIDIDIDLC